MWKSMLQRLRDPRVLRAQAAAEAEFIFRLFPLNALGSDVVPRPVRWLGYRLGGMKVKSPNLYPGLVIAGDPARIEIGEDTFLNRGCLIESVGHVRFGKGVQVGPQAAFITSHHPRREDGTIMNRAEGRDIVIGDGCWIGARAMILPGVTLARDVVVAAGAVVAKDCTVAGAVYAGVPARLVKQPEPAYLAAQGSVA